ncbi:unnamed protein product [Pleuronectes platessa]|uniref:Uncharacterized protein n=1 Tax=Pleuronectes platessa TaxID=8262 RepID=A0A9N7Z118_PLEPL|nr:unnamed protein product [Pleuronectes platessa]
MFMCGSTLFVIFKLGPRLQCETLTSHCSASIWFDSHFVSIHLKRTLKSLQETRPPSEREHSPFTGHEYVGWLRVF